MFLFPFLTPFKPSSLNLLETQKLMESGNLERLQQGDVEMCLAFQFGILEAFSMDILDISFYIAITIFLHLRYRWLQSG